VVPLSALETSLSHVISSHYAKLIPKNIEAIRAGAARAA
jgi:2-oxoglutarate ferredoxin oxidoreductase subunit gamma